MKLNAFASLLLLNMVAIHAAAGVNPEVADADAIKAFRTYWGAFEEYERRQQKSSKEAYEKAWDALKSEYDQSQAKLLDQRLADLNGAIKKYKTLLQKYSDTPNRPFVMLNLAQALLAFTDTKTKADVKADVSTDRRAALALLKEIDSKFPDFEHREAALYLLAITLESLKQSDQAMPIWRRLATNARSTLYGVHAHIAIGDAAFRANNPKSALDSYSAAANLLERIDTPDKDYELVRTQYRMAWAAYRSAELDVAVSAAIALLSPGRDMRTANFRKRVQEDATELLGDAVYELNDPTKAARVLRVKDVDSFASSVALRAMQRYSNERQYEDVIAIGKIVVSDLLSQVAAPECLNVLADAYKNLGQTRGQIEALEHLAMLLPKQSLWHAKHKDNLDATNKMENLSRFAAKLAAAYHYDKGMASGGAPHFVAAGSFYDILIDNDPTGEQSSEWRLRRAHCAYFSGNYRAAVAAYAELKQQLRVSAAILEVAAYQSVLAQERLWQEAFGKNDDEAARQEMQALEQSAQDFVNRFPDRSRAVDLLLVVAGCFRDMQEFTSAAKYWQRVMVSKPNVAQRTVAIRGLVLAQMRLGSPGDVVAAAKRYLQLENWQAMGAGLANELLGIVATAVTQEGDRLSRSGQVAEAGALLVNTATELPNLPRRAAIYRDGSYMLAVAGNWEAAHIASEKFNKHGMRSFAGDMLYLQARADEYLLRFGAAAKEYYELGATYPKHPKADSSLSRAESLAAAEGDLELAGKASRLHAERTRNKNVQMQLYTRSAEYFAQAGSATTAVAVANSRLRSAPNLEERMQSRFLAAKAQLQAGDTEAAITALNALSNGLLRQKSRIDDGSYKNLYSETNVILGDDMLRQLEDFNIGERSGSVARNAEEKMSIYERTIRYYDRAISTQHPQWATKARYQSAAAAEHLADELAITLKSDTARLNVTQSQRLLESSKKLREVAKRFHSDNLASKAKQPNIYRQNAWVRRSSAKLTGIGSESPQTDYGAPTPTAVQSDMPSQWSL